MPNLKETIGDKHTFEVEEKKTVEKVYTKTELDDLKRKYTQRKTRAEAALVEATAQLKEVEDMLALITN